MIIILKAKINFVNLFNNVEILKIIELKAKFYLMFKKLEKSFDQLKWTKAPNIELYKMLNI